MKIYGPVKSRRLGNSLGIDLNSPAAGESKSCPYSCAYCNLPKSKTNPSTQSRAPAGEKDYAQLEKIIASKRHIDHITFSGMGEPTENTALGEIAEKIKSITNIPLILLTNSYYLTDENTRNSAEKCDGVHAKLDAPTQELFEKINSPPKGTRLEDITSSIPLLRTRICIQTMLLESEQYTNADEKTIKKFIEIYRKMNETHRKITRNSIEIYLCTVTRPPQDKGIRPIAEDRLKEIAEKIARETGLTTRYVTDKGEDEIGPKESQYTEIIEIIRHLEYHPSTIRELSGTYHRKETDIQCLISMLQMKNIVTEERHGKKAQGTEETFYRAKGTIPEEELEKTIISLPQISGQHCPRLKKARSTHC